MVEPVEFGRNFLKQVVCELRFPTLLEVEPPALARFQRATRKVLPWYDALASANVSVAGGSAQSRVVQQHRFQTKQRNWAVLLTPDRLVFDTSRYTAFSGLAALLEDVLPAAVDVIDTPFFTRLGLRYVNAVPVVNERGAPLTDAINADLVGALAAGVFGEVSHYVQEVQGKLSRGNYLFRHGLPSGEAGRDRLEYMIDFDFFDEAIEIAEVIPRLREFNDHAFSFFMWALGEKTRAQLIATSKKKTV